MKKRTDVAWEGDEYECRRNRVRGKEGGRFYTGFAARQAYLHGNDMRRGRTDGVPPVAVAKVVGGKGFRVGDSELVMVFRAQVLNVAAKCIGYYG